MERKFSLTSRHEPEPYVRTTATNGDHDAIAETPIATIATTAPGAPGPPGAYDNDNDPDDEH